MGAGQASKIFCFDGKSVAGHPEDMAMLQALYSRNPGSIIDKLKEVGGDKAGKLMSTYYVGYGHQSIGDCGHFTLFIENVSMIAAKVIQHHPLYIGQEASTRYLDFSKQGYVDVATAPEIMEFLLDGYRRTLDDLKQSIRKDNPWSETTGVNLSEWEKACNARAFDIARGLLPTGTKTSLSWTTSFRNCWDHLKKTATHKSSEIKHLAQGLFETVSGQYPQSFPTKIEWPDLAYFDSAFPEITDEELKGESETVLISLLSNRLVKYLVETTALDRKRGEPLHHDLDANVWLKVGWEIDYGSFRDLQRHRNQKMPLPCIEKGAKFSPWYLDNLGAIGCQVLEDFRAKYEPLLKDVPVWHSQYYYPMASMVKVPMVMSLGQAVYVVETRSSKTVHPTLRSKTLELGAYLKDQQPKLKVHVDQSEDKINWKRGKQDIVKQPEGK